MNPKHTGFDHLKLYFLSQRKLLKIDYNCPPPESLLGVQLAGQHRTDSLHLDLLAHSLNTKNTLSMLLHVFFYGNTSITG
jgi:hypothetical protein